MVSVFLICEVDILATQHPYQHLNKILEDALDTEKQYQKFC